MSTTSATTSGSVYICTRPGEESEPLLGNGVVARAWRSRVQWRREQWGSESYQAKNVEETAGYQSHARRRHDLGPDRETRAIALLDALPALHRIGKEGAVLILQRASGFRAVLVDFDPSPAVIVIANPPEPLPESLEDVGVARVAAIFTNDGRYLERAADDSILTAKWDERPVPASLLARAVSSAWRDLPPRPDDPGLSDALPGIRATFQRLVLRLLEERLTWVHQAAWKEKELWEQSPAARRAHVVGLFAKTAGKLQELIDAVAAQRPLILAKVRERTRQSGGDPHDIRATVTLEGVEFDSRIAIANHRLQVLASQAMFIATQGNGAAGFVHRSDLYDGVALRSVDDARDNVVARLEEMLQKAQDLQVRVQLALTRTSGDRELADLLAVRPVRELAFARSFGGSAQPHSDAYRDVFGDEPWAPVSPVALEEMRARLLGDLPPTDLARFQNNVSMASLVTMTFAGALGLTYGTVLLPLGATVLSWIGDSAEMWRLLANLGRRAEITHVALGVDGYRDPDLMRDIFFAGVAGVFSAVSDLHDAPKMLHELLSTPSVRQLIARSSKLKGMARWLEFQVSDQDRAVAALAAEAIGSSRVRFENLANATHWMADLTAKLDARDMGAAAQMIRSKGGWSLVCDGLDSVGAARGALDAARIRLLDEVRAAHARLARPEAVSGVLELTVESLNDVAGAATALSLVRTHFQTQLGLGVDWERLLGVNLGLKVSAGDAGDVANYVRDLWRASGANMPSPNVAPSAVQNGLATNFVHRLHELGGWKAISRQVGGTGDAATELEAMRQQLYGYISQRFGVRRVGTPGFASDFDVSVMHDPTGQRPGIAARTRDLESFMGRIAGASPADSRIWKRAFDMEVFVDPSLATVHDLLPRNELKLVLAHHVCSRADILSEMMRVAGADLRVGHELLAQFAKEHGFPRDLLTAGIAGAASMTPAQLTAALRQRSPAQLRDALADKMDDAMREMNAALTRQPQLDLEIVERARRVSDVAIAQAMANDEAYFLAGATKLVMTIREGSKLYRGINEALTTLRRVYLEELEHSLTENWFGHVLPDLRKAFDASWSSLAASERERVLKKAFFQLGKYGDTRAVGFFLEETPRFGVPRTEAQWLGAAAALKQRLQRCVDVGKGLKTLRDSAPLASILRALGKLSDAELETVGRLDLERLGWPGPHLGPTDLARLAPGGSLHPDTLVTRAREALQHEVEQLIGVGNIGTLSIAQLGHYPAGSILGDLQRLMKRAKEVELLAMDQWLLSRLAIRGGKALASDSSASEPLAPREGRLLGDVSSPGKLDPVDLDHLGLGNVWAAVQP